MVHFQTNRKPWNQVKKKLKVKYETHLVPIAESRDPSRVPCATTHTIIAVEYYAPELNDILCHGVVETLDETSHHRPEESCEVFRLVSIFVKLVDLSQNSLVIRFLP